MLVVRLAKTHQLASRLADSKFAANHQAVDAAPRAKRHARRLLIGAPPRPRANGSRDLVHEIASAPALDFPLEIFSIFPKKFHPAGASMVHITAATCGSHRAIANIGSRNRRTNKPQRYGGSGGLRHDRQA
jgi:hypothetical protein